MTTTTVTNILLVGVGGQGTLLAAEVMSEALMAAGYDVKKSEIHGMSQRGGSVVSHVRFGQVVHSPIICEGDADIIFGFELLEAYRCLSFLKPNGTVIANDLRIPPPSVLLGKEPYPGGLAERIKAGGAELILVDGLKLATEAGNPKAANTVLLGALSQRLDIDERYWQAALEKMVPAKALAVNQKAFQFGRAI